MTWPLNQKPVSDLRYNKFTSSDHNLCRAFVDFRFENDEKVTSS